MLILDTHPQRNCLMLVSDSRIIKNWLGCWRGDNDGASTPEKKHSIQFKSVFDAICKLMHVHLNKIGFQP